MSYIILVLTYRGGVGEHVSISVALAALLGLAACCEERTEVWLELERGDERIIIMSERNFK